MLVDSRKLSHAGDAGLCAHAPTWSPDSRRIAFTAFFPEGPPAETYEHRIYLVNADGSGLTELLSFQMKDRVPPGTQALWSPDGKQVAFAYEVAGIYKSFLMNADGSGEAEEIDSIPDSWSPTHWPQWGQSQAASTAQCRTVSVDKNQENDLFVQNCDGSNKRRLTVHRTGGSDIPSWSPDGQRVVFDATFGAERWDAGIYLINADGTGQTELIAPKGQGGFGRPATTPDGKRIAYMDGCTIKTMNLDGSDMATVVKSTDLMNHPGDPEMCAYEAVWSPDSQRLALWAFQLADWYGNFPGPYERRVAVVNADGTRLTDVAAFRLKAPVGGVTVYWSLDGCQVAYLVWEDNTANYYIVNADGSNQPIEIESIPDSWSQSHWPQWDRGGV